MIKYLTSDDVTELKQFCKEYKIKGCRQVRLARRPVHLGTQCHRIERDLAFVILNKLKEKGFVLGMEDTTFSLADCGLLDTILIDGRR